MENIAGEQDTRSRDRVIAAVFIFITEINNPKCAYAPLTTNPRVDLISATQVLLLPQSFMRKVIFQSL